MLRRLNTQYGWIVTDMTAETWFSVFNDETLRNEYTLHPSRRFKSVVSHHVIPAIRAVSGMQGTSASPKMFTVQQDGLINSCSETLLKWGGWTQEEIIGVEFATICNEATPFLKLIKGEENICCSQYTDIFVKEGTRRMYVIAFPVSANEHQHTMIMLQDHL